MSARRGISPVDAEYNVRRVPWPPDLGALAVSRNPKESPNAPFHLFASIDGCHVCSPRGRRLPNDDRESDGVDRQDLAGFPERQPDPLGALQA